MKLSRKVLKSITPRKRWLNKELGLLVLALLLIGYGLSYFYQRQATLKPVVLPSPNTVVTSSTAHPSEAAINTKTTAYKVADNMPRLISLPSIGAEGFIQPVAIDTKTNAVAVPTNVHLAGWYTKSVKPGEEGLSIIDGHVAGYYAPGIFQQLGKLKPGDQFRIEYGNGSLRNFQVASKASYDVADAPRYLFNKDPAIAQQLDLITCSGAYDKSRHQYTQRTLVIARRI